MGHPTDKIELIVMGGTFLAYPEDYQYGFIIKINFLDF
jgi:elongator complex protein 3